MNVLKHRFNSAKLDGPDATQVQPSAWNDGHAFTGGAAGDVLTRDPSDGTFGATWASRGSTYVGGATIATLPTSARDHVLILTNSGDLLGAIPDTGTFAIGSRLMIRNESPGAITLVHQSTSVATGRFFNFATASRATQLSTNTGAAVYLWDSGNWVLMTHTQGAGVPIGLTDANLSGCTATMGVNDFTLRGVDLQLRVLLNPAVLPTSLAKISIVGWPWTFAIPSSWPILIGTANVPTSWSPCAVVVGAASIDVYQMDTSQPWPAGNVYAGFDITVPIL
jgi:hypothetical protein